MEINNSLLNNNVSLNDSSTLSSSINLKALENAGSLEISNSSFTLEIDTSLRRSDFSNTLRESLNQLSINQQNIQYTNKQEKILSTIQDAAQSLQSSDNFEVTQEKVQAQIQTAIVEYNQNVDYLADFAQFQEDTNSKGYFDGILGAKPLRASEILQAVEQKRENLAQINTASTKAVEQIEQQSLNTIGAEIEKAAARAPYEPVDFGKNTTDFTSTNINSIVGSVVSAQANAIPAHSAKLLS